MSKRIISFILVFAISISAFPLSVFADSSSVDYQSMILNYWDSLMYALCYYRDSVGAAVSAYLKLDDSLDDAGGGLISDMCGMTASFLDPDTICEFSDDHYHHASSLSGSALSYSDSYGYYTELTCKHCGLPFNYYSADLQYLYDDSVSTLPDGLNASSSGVTAYGTGFKIDSSDGNADSKAYWETIDIYSIFNSSNSGYMLTTYYTLYSDAYYTGFRLLDSDVSGVTFVQYFTIASLLPYTSATYPLATLVSGFNTITSSSTMFCRNLNEAVAYFTASNEPVYFLTPESYIFQRDTTRYYGGCYLYHMGYINQNGNVSYDTSLNISSGNLKSYVSNRGLLPLEADYSDSYDSTSRVSSLTQSISKYNSGNNWVDNSTTVNYFIGTVGEDGTVSDVYDIALYDEETLIFTEPVTGAQYQTSGWTYYYTTRSYDIDVESGTFAIGDSDITQIICTYGDDAVSIGYYDSSGSEVQTDEYAYVMVSQSQCSLTGHVNTVETTKEPTCTRTGERTYTCSVCGNVSVEDIPMMGHSKQYSEFKSPTCTDSGLALYSCTTCGDEVSENIDPLGHDWLATEVVATTYSLPEGTSCPECSGTDFTGVLDDVNQIYNCACNSCAAAWTVSADETLGYTVYTCSRCEKTRIEYDGEDGDGLFKSIGNFIANGLTWCTEKLSQLVDNFTSILDTFNEYTELVGAQNSSYPSFLTAVIDGLPADLMAVVWFAVMVFVVLAVIKIFFR